MGFIIHTIPIALAILSSNGTCNLNLGLKFLSQYKYMNVKYNKKKSLKFILNYSVMFSVISKKM